MTEKVKFNNLNCRDINSHNLPSKHPNSKCRWCGKTRTEIKEEEKKKDIIYGKGRSK